jgi:hypothetical protein
MLNQLPKEYKISTIITSTLESESTSVFDATT